MQVRQLAPSVFSILFFASIKILKAAEDTGATSQNFKLNSFFSLFYFAYIPTEGTDG